MKTTRNLLFVLAILLLVGPRAAMGQIPDDWNHDGVIGPGDLGGLDSCMDGPTVPAEGACSIFLLGNAASVDLAAALAFQVAQQPTTPCTQDTLPRTHVAASWHYVSIKGVLAKITDRSPALCGDATSTARARSAWSITLQVDEEPRQYPIYWSQVGIVINRSDGPDPLDPGPPSTVIRHVIYTEVNSGWDLLDPNDQQPGSRYDRRYWQAPTQNNPDPDGATYWTYLNPSYSDGVQFVVYDPTPNEVDYLYRHPNWTGRVGTTMLIQGEVWNPDDRMAGTAATHCRFSDCTYEAGTIGNFVPTEFVGDEVNNLNPALYNMTAIGSTVEMWDCRD